MGDFTMNEEPIKNCALCGKPYVGYGNSTWGYWEAMGMPKDDTRGEKLRCCDNCNLYQVIPARMKLMKMGNNAKTNH